MLLNSFHTICNHCQNHVPSFAIVYEHNIMSVKIDACGFQRYVVKTVLQFGGHFFYYKFDMLTALCHDIVLQEYMLNTVIM